MKKIVCLLLLGCCHSVFSQQLRKIEIRQDLSQSILFDSRYASAVDSAIKITEKFYNSQLFQDSMAHLSFNKKSLCRGYRSGYRRNARISGNDVLTIFFNAPTMMIGVHLQNTVDSGGSLGFTGAGSHYTTANLKPIMHNMQKDFPGSYAYPIAVNLCHELLHVVGFCHTYGRLNEGPNGDTPDPRYFPEDVTYRVGWMAFYVLKKVKEQGGYDLSGHQ